MSATMLLLLCIGTLVAYAVLMPRWRLAPVDPLIASIDRCNAAMAALRPALEQLLRSQLEFVDAMKSAEAEWRARLSQRQRDSYDALIAAGWYVCDAMTVVERLEHEG